MAVSFEAIRIIVVILLTGVVCARIAQRLNVPTLIPLLICGMLIGPAGFSFLDLSDRSVHTRMAINWGIYPFLVPKWHDLRHAFLTAENFAVRKKLVKPGDQLAVLAGDPHDPPGLTNVLKLTTIYKKR